MKLDDIHIGVSPITNRIYLGTVSKRDRGTWSSKVDCTSKFIGALMEWAPPGTVQTANDNCGGAYEIEVRKVSDKHAAQYPAQAVEQAVAQRIRDRAAQPKEGGAS